MCVYLSFLPTEILYNKWNNKAAGLIKRLKGLVLFVLLLTLQNIQIVSQSSYREVKNNIFLYIRNMLHKSIIVLFTRNKGGIKAD